MPIQLSPFEQKIVADCDVLFCAGIWRDAKNIISLCDTQTKRSALVEEIKTTIRNPSLMKLTWNGEIFNFGGSDFGYVGYFKYDVIDAIIKMAFRISPDERQVIVGIITIATRKEAHKFQKHTAALDDAAQK